MVQIFSAVTSKQPDCADETRSQASLNEIYKLNRYLPLALHSLAAEDYLNLIAFTQDFPEEVARLGDFLDSLFEENPMSDRPMGQGLYICAAGTKLPGANPLQSSAGKSRI